MDIRTLEEMPISERKAYALKKVKGLQDKLNASITIIEDDEVKADGKLKGIPVALKDNISTKGIKTTAASDILDNYVPVYDATIVKKLKEAGAIFVSKTSMDELAMGGTNRTANIGPCHNPYDLDRITGGSSGGSAALVAAGAVPLAIGSDTGDSVRKPAAYCGIVGVKPSYGRISRYGIIPYASSLDHVGYFTTNVEDAALALEVLAGRDDLDMTSSYEEVLEYSKLLDANVKGRRLAIFGNVYDAISDSSIKEAFDKLPKKEATKTGEICPECGSELVIRKGKYGEFTACSNFPTCKYIKQEEKKITEIIDCPNCDGKIIEKRSKKGKIFYGCNNYPKCKTAYWDMPIDEKCPKCNSVLTVKGKKVKCSSCDYIKED